MTKADLKKWLDEDNTNRLFIRRIGIPQYKLVGITDVKELRDIKKELEATIRNVRYMQDLRTIKGSEWMQELYRCMHSSAFTGSNWRVMKNIRENPSMLHEVGDFICWRLILFKNFGHDNSWWSAYYDLSAFYKNVRLYLRNKVADKIVRENKVYTVKSNLNYVMSVNSKFDVQWARGLKIPAGTPLFFVERDYAGRMIFMTGQQCFALSTVQVQKVRELKEEKE